MTDKIGKILVIDDEIDVRKYISTLLVDNGFEVLTAENGKEGLEIAKESLPDLITLDIAMPEESGFTTFQEFKNDKRTKGIPIIIITGFDIYLKDSFSKFNLTSELDGYFEKPIDREAFIKKIKELLKF